MTGRPRFCPLAGAVAPCSLLNTTTATTLCRFAVCIHTGKLPKPRKVKDFYLRRLAMNTADHDAMHKRNCGAAHSWAAWQQVVDKSWPWDKCMLPTAVSRVKTEALFSFFFFSVSRLLLRLHSSVHVLHHSCHPEQQISFLFIYLQQNCVVCCCVCVCVCWRLIFSSGCSLIACLLSVWNEVSNVTFINTLLSAKPSGRFLSELKWMIQLLGFLRCTDTKKCWFQSPVLSLWPINGLIDFPDILCEKQIFRWLLSFEWF